MASVTAIGAKQQLLLQVLKRLEPTIPITKVRMYMTNLSMYLEGYPRTSSDLGQCFYACQRLLSFSSLSPKERRAVEEMKQLVTDGMKQREDEGE